MTGSEDMEVSERRTKVVVDRKKSLQPDELYRNLQQSGIRSVQFVPMVERDEHGYLKAESVTSEDWGRFLKTVFDIWVREDITRISVQLFDNTLNQWCGRPGHTVRHAISPLSARCQACSLLQFYRGDCPAFCHDSGKGGLCAGYQAFFNHSSPHMRVMRDLIKQHRSPAELMAMLR
ncbi:radical SAM protein [Citrobacter pasteurii]